MIRFIVCGWHMNQPSLFEGLAYLQEQNPDDVHVFWSCHREPTDFIKENFDYEVFFNGGEEYGAYEQAINHLDIDDNDACFFMHDDLVIKDWEFVETCVNDITSGYYYNDGSEYMNVKIIGNGPNYLVADYDYNEVIDVGIKEEFDGMKMVDYVKPENRHIFDRPISQLCTVRPSFMVMLYKTVKEIGGFEPRHDAYVSPKKVGEKEDGRGKYEYRGGKKLSSWGNAFPNLNNYKYNRLFSFQQIVFLSSNYLHSKWIHECARGKHMEAEYENSKESHNIAHMGDDIQKVMGRDR
jgi:hypothetical protein